LRKFFLGKERVDMGPLGVPELLVIFVIALIVFGPKKLPDLGRSLGKSIAEFKRASNDLRNTLEEEVRMEEIKEQRKAALAAPPLVSEASTETFEHATETAQEPVLVSPMGETVARGAQHS
jgi:sec-independent protein translocase protein TatA